MKKLIHGLTSFIILIVALPISAADSEGLKSSELWLDSPVTADMTLSINNSMRDNKKAMECFRNHMNALDKSFRNSADENYGMFVVDANAVGVLNGETIVVVAEMTSGWQMYHKGGPSYKKHEQWMIGKYQVATSKSLVNLKCE